MNRGEIDWSKYAGIATGILGWSPDIFWSATPEEFRMALQGWQLLHCGGFSSQPLKRGELHGLLDRFPDH